MIAATTINTKPINCFKLASLTLFVYFAPRYPPTIAAGPIDDLGYTNVEFRKGDIEKKIPIDDNTVDLVISNCVINLTTYKVDTFKEVHRILKQGQGRMVISDLITDKEVHRDSVDSEKWCSCIDGALTKENYLESIRKAGFQNPEILEEKLYIQEERDNKVDSEKRISSIVVKAVKD